MNKQELIDYCNVLKESKSRFINCIDVDRIIDTIKQLDEPRKVKVKKFVADWYEEHKDEFEYNVWDWLSSKSELGKIDSKFAFWLNDVDNTPIQTLVNMHQFGYEVEEEKRYFVKVKATKHYISKDGIGKIFFSLAYKESFTKKELEEAGFGWVFDCPGIEIEEVE
ncbi:MAG: DUF1642 domain-containing protein [Streptococcus agalactiae]|nr:DUF1642 domain-containing protein [Streptococcus agalactiae]